jgi:hypothetical protein
MENDTRVTEEQKAQLSKRRGMAATKIVDPEERRKFISAQGDAEAVNKGELPVKKAKQMSEEAGLMGFKKGTPSVPKTGAAIVHKGERIVPAEKNNPMGLAEAALAHKDREPADKPAKRIKEIRTRKAKSGGYIHEHHHTAPEAHPMEEHNSADQAAMLAHMGEQAPNMGDAEPAQEEGGME